MSFCRLIPSTFAAFRYRGLCRVLQAPRTVRSFHSTQLLAYASVGKGNSLPPIVRANHDEQLAGQLSPRSLEQAVQAIHLDGLVVVENAVDDKSLDQLNTKMVEDAQVLQARGKDGPFNYNTGNLQQDPPPLREFFLPSIFLNSFAKQITSNVLGPHPKWTFCSGNSAMPPVDGSSPQRQPVHSDADFAHPSHPFALVVNVPLIDFTPENGSTELWLGTHVPELSGLGAQEGSHGERASGRIKESLLESRRRSTPPIQPPVKKGSIVVRDLRLWHAGMPNFTNDIRVMIALSTSPMSRSLEYC
jgi:ectoine hydroxylase-related dioxygenase (phytanoyl-CoA dioxygenase family)